MRRKFTSLGSGESVTLDNWGQSNANGSTDGVSPPIPLQYPMSNVKIISYQTPTEYENLHFGQNNRGSLFGAELSYGYYSNNPVFMRKVAEGGTSLFNQWASGGYLRERAIEYAILGNSISKTNKNFVYWNQGEADSNQTQSAYYNALVGLKTEMESRIGVTYDKWIIAKANPLSVSYSADIEAAQIQFVNELGARGVLLDLDHLPLRDDDLHYSADAQIEIGKMLLSITG